MPTDTRDQELVGLVARGDERAVTVLYDRYAGPLYGFGLRRLGDRSLAEQLVQEVMTRLWRAAGRFDPERASVRTWIFTMARSVVIDLHRQRKRPRAVAVVEEPTDELDQLLRAELVRAAIERLTVEHRTVLEVLYFEGLTQAEAAARLGVPVGTVKSRAYYALRAMRLACDELGVDR